MKLAFTADLHLTSQASNPERFHSLESILKSMIKDQIRILIIAGDLFDKDAQEYNDFEKIINKKIYNNLEIIIINGNHDIGLKNGLLKCDTVQVYNQPTILDESVYGIDLLLVPYHQKKTMGEILVAYKNKMKPKSWVLVSHGDWFGGSREVNPYEQGVYMPLTRKDFTINEPVVAVLGHIHKPYDSSSVIIPGSPCGLNISETGLRSFVVLNTNNRQFKRILIETDIIFMDESIVLFPMPDEEVYLAKKIEEEKVNWGIPVDNNSKIILRLKVEGYCFNPKMMKDSISKAFKAYQFYKDEGIDFCGLKNSDDLEKNYIANVIQNEISKLDLKSGDREPDKEQILLSALEVIYGK